MPFKHKIVEDKNIVVLKAKGNVSVTDIISEIQVAIDTKRGEGITRRLIDMTEQKLEFKIEDAQKILKMMKASASALGSKRIAILFKEIPDNFDFGKIKSLMSSSTLEIDLFTDKAKAAQFLSKPIKK